jgi:hypothetical protein
MAEDFRERKREVIWIWANESGNALLKLPLVVLKWINVRQRTLRSVNGTYTNRAIDSKTSST